MIRYTTNPPSRLIAPRPLLKPSERPCPQRSPLLIAIDEYLTRSGMSAAGFGQLATGDRRFVSRLREARDPGAAATNQARAFLERVGARKAVRHA